MTCVSMGNPHAVFFVDSLEAVALTADGPAVERHPLFSERVNAHFVEVADRERVKVLTWERGSGATRACGTGACAVCVAGARTGRTERRIVAEVPGGELEVEWAEDGRVYLAGEAVEVFAGEWVGEEGTEAGVEEGTKAAGRKGGNLS
jgi:diaminopimelate epimerase